MRVSEKHVHTHRPACPTSGTAVRGVLISLAFWSCLALSGLAYAAATLSVRYAQNRELQLQFAAGETELRQLMAQVRRYEQYCDQLSRPSANLPTPSETTRSMAVDPSLTFQLDTPAGDRHHSRAVAKRPIVIGQLNRSPVLRGTLLTGAAALILFAFGVLGDGDGARRAGPKRTWSIRGPLSQRIRKIGARYHLARRER